MLSLADKLCISHASLVLQVVAFESIYVIEQVGNACVTESILDSVSNFLGVVILENLGSLLEEVAAHGIDEDSVPDESVDKLVEGHAQAQKSSNFGEGIIDGIKLCGVEIQVAFLIVCLVVEILKSNYN